MEPAQFISTSHDDAAAVAFLNDLFRQAANQGASDLHLEDYEQGCRVRWRVNGGLIEKPPIDSAMARNIDSKIRMKARLPLSERKQPLDGRFYMQVDERIVDVRVSLIPIRQGQSMAFRILDQNSAGRSLADVTMPADIRAALQSALRAQEGFLIVAGPTGSGKTSTLYACLQELNGPERKIVTIEDPVEYRLEYACQINVEAGLSFGSALRATLRQDPDIVLVGEIRDAETAKIATQAALTGHLVLSTLHANDAASALTRLLDLEVDSFTLGAALRAVIAQRLSPRLCPRCAREEAQATISDDDSRWLRAIGHKDPPPLWVARGCEFCEGSGRCGRVPIMEMIVGSRLLREAIQTADKRSILRAASVQAQHESLATAAVRAAVDGLIPLDGARAVVGSLE